MNTPAPVQNYIKYLPMILVITSIISSAVIAQDQISDNKEHISDNKLDIKELQKDKELQIRMEERQKVMKEDVAEIKELLKRLAK